MGTNMHMLQTGIGDLFARSYFAFDALPAADDGARSLTYGALGRRVQDVVKALAAHGVRRGDRIFIATDNRVEFLEVEHATFAGAFVRVGISPKLNVEEAIYIINDCRAVAAFADGAWAGQLSAVADRLPTLRLLVNFDGAGAGTGYADFLAAGADGVFEPHRQPDDLAALLYTSGTTGRPKGAMMAQRTLASVTRNHLVDVHPVDESDVVLHVGPLAHMSGVFSWCYFVRGASHIILNRFDPAEVLRTVRERRVTTLFVVPTMLNRLVDAAAQLGWSNDSLRTIMYGASPIAPDRLEKAIAVFGNVFVQCYGQSEFQLISSMLRPAHRYAAGQPPRHLVSAGRPNPYVEVRIVDPEGRVLDAGEVGEIAVRSDTVMDGYWEQPEATAAALSPDGWLLTGDVGYLGPEGYLYLVDRRQEMIVSGGYNVYPNEVENAISAMPGIQEVAVLGAPDPDWGEAVTAVVVVRDGCLVSEADVLDACRQRLARYKVPKAVHFEAELPKSPVGKILRRTLRDAFWKDHERRIG